MAIGLRGADQAAEAATSSTAPGAIAPLKNSVRAGCAGCDGFPQASLKLWLDRLHPMCVGQQQTLRQENTGAHNR